MAYRRKRDWPNDFAGHSKASKKGWRRKKRSRDPADRDWPNDHRGHSRAAKLGWCHRGRKRRRDWPNDHEGHVKAGKLAWKRRRRKGGAHTKRAGGGGKGGYSAAYGAVYRRRGRPVKFRRDESMMDPGPRRRHFRRFRRRRYR